MTHGPFNDHLPKTNQVVFHFPNHFGECSRILGDLGEQPHSGQPALKSRPSVSSAFINFSPAAAKSHSVSSRTSVRVAMIWSFTPQMLWLIRGWGRRNRRSYRHGGPSRPLSPGLFLVYWVKHRPELQPFNGTPVFKRNVQIRNGR